jgi:very-short-patch-repair endonuclease
VIVQQRRLVALVDYAQQSMRTRSRVVSNVADHGSFLLFDHQAGAIEGVRLNDGGADGDDEIWLSVPHPPGPDVPPQSDSPWLAPWLNVGAAMLVAPQLATEIEGVALIAAGTHRDAGKPAASVAEAADPNVDPRSRVRFVDYGFRAEVEAQHASYLETVWTPWAEAERKRRRLSNLYVKLFTLQQELAGALIEGQLELVWGMGLGVARRSGTAFAYPLVTRLVDLNFDAESQTAEVRPRDLDPRLELEFFAQAEGPAAAEAEKAAEDFLANAAEPLSPFEPSTYEPLVAIARRCLGVSVAAADSPESLAPVAASVDEDLKITSAWVLFARPRSTNVTMQDLERFREILNGLDQDARLPGAVAALVTEPATENAPLTLPVYRGVSAAYHESAEPESAGARDLFFPKPFNDEQARIVQLLETSDGVVVQGPPGTGKTHTIANIICHWLANGRRVLVTSMRDPALAVLRDQLPEAIRPLAISLLAAEQDGVNQFEHSIQKIAAEVQSLDALALGREIARLEETIDAFHGRLQRIDTDLGRWAKLNLSRIDLGGESIDPQDAAAEVLQKTGQFEWIPDAIGVGPQYAPRFTGDDIARLREAREQLGGEIDHAGNVLPVPADFPDTLQLVKAHDELQRFMALIAQARASDVPALAGSGAEAFAQARTLAEHIARVKALREDIAALRLPWPDEVVDGMKRGEPGQAFEMLDSLAFEIEQAAAQRMQSLARPIVLPEMAETDAGFLQAATNLAEGRRAFGMSSLFGRPEAGKLLDLVRVSGAPPAQPADWQSVLDHLALQKKRRSFTARWNALAPELGFQSVLSVDAKGRLSADSQLAMYAKVKLLAKEEIELCHEAMNLFPAWPSAALAGLDAAVLVEVEHALSHHLNKYQLGQISSVLEDLHRALEGKRGKIVDDLRDFLARTLGNPALDESTLLGRWSALMAELARLHALAGPLRIVSEVTASIAESGAQKLAQRLRQSAQGDEDEVLPETLLRDWRLRRLATHLQAIDAQEEFRKLSAARAGIEHDLARAYNDLVVKRTWLKLAENATPSVRAALQAYLNAIQRIGKGTGKRAFRYRRDARFAAAEAHRAVPCWIMPHHRVSESLPAQLGCFDLVVIDEASQSDLSALPVLLRARKLLIVGDDRQVSPQAIGLEEERVKALMQRYLPDQVPLFRAQMSPDRSIYDLAKVVFARSGVMLKEHFRCVAPIIEYSKREFYAHELRPLRLARSSERLDPPLQDYLIGDARRDNGVNRAEVEFIVGEIKALAADPKMRQRSVGVVSLLGEEQAVRIWERLTEELGPDVMRRHAVTCGDARLFQGRERDIMYLSMVSAPNEVGAPLSRDTFAQRFNVAASRARDRMILVRSVELHHLSDADRLRRSLIMHFARPFNEEPVRVKDLREICESPPERELFDWLNGEGYQVTPQVAVGAYRVDLVVEGRDDARLAVECDGDKYHGPQQWIEDMRRQRSLERVGWVFWRCFAAALRCRREAVLDDLRQALSAQGIEPIGRGGWGRRRMTETKRVRAAETVAAA